MTKRQATSISAFPEALKPKVNHVSDPSAMADSTTGILSLPAELFIEIVSQSLPEAIDAYRSWIGELSRVCKRWKAIIESTPSFWTKIHSLASQQSIYRALVMSRGLPLDFLFVYKGPSSLCDLARFFDRVERCSFCLGVRDITPVRTLGLVQGAPELEVLSISSGDVNWYEDTVRAVALFNSRYPKLRVINIRNTPVTVDWTTTSTLTHLNVTQGCSEWYDDSDWPLLILRHNPQLISFELHNYVQDVHAMPKEPPNFIHLPELIRLRLMYNTYEMSQRILEAVVAPVCSDFIIDNFDDDYILDLTYELNEGFNRLAHSMLLQPHSECLIVFFAGAEQSLTLSLDGRQMFRASFPEFNPRAISLRWIKLICSGANSVPEVRLHIRTYDGPPMFEEGDFWGALADVPHVTLLHLIAWKPDEVIELFLKRPSVFPTLAVLRLELCKCPPESIIPILQVRNADWYLPPLEELYITSEGIEDDPPESIKVLVGKTQLFWKRTWPTTGARAVYFGK